MTPRRERIPGGLGSGRPPSDFDPEQLAAGIRVEMEHVEDTPEGRAIASEIARDHLTEDPDYYRKLARMEAEKALRGDPVGALIKSGYGGVVYLVFAERLPDEAAPELQLAKAGPHKYIRRVPTGKPKPKYRYYYKVSGHGVVTGSHLQAGARFSASDDGTPGYWQVVSEGKGRVQVKHSGSGRSEDLPWTEFQKLVNAQHQEAWSANQGKLRGEILASLRVLQGGKGGPNQAKRVLRLVDAAHKRGWITDKERDLYLRRVETSKAYVESEKQKKVEKKGEVKAALKVKEAEEEERYREAQEAQAGLGVAGKRSSMMVSDTSGQGRPQPMRYRLIDVADIRASHVPSKHGRFKINTDYPAGVQERTYHRSETLQNQVRAHASGLKPEFLVNTNPDAAQGPPIVTPSGIVLGGNSRTMTLDLVYQSHPEQAEKYRQMLRDQASHFGLRADDVDKVKRPVLVREVDEPEDKEGQIDLVRRYNESFTQAMDPREEQVARAKRMGRVVFDTLADTIGADDTLDAYMRSGRSKKLVDALVGEGVIDRRDVDRYIGRSGATKGKLNEDGRTLVSRLLLGKFVPDADVLEGVGKDMRERLAAVIPHMLAAQKANPGYQLVDMDNPDAPSPLRSAIEGYAAMVSAGKKLPSEVWTQRDMFGVHVPKGMDVTELVPSDHPLFKDPLAQTILAAMVAKKTKIGPAFRRFASLAEENHPKQTKMPGERHLSPREAAAAAFGFRTDDPVAEAEKLIREKKTGGEAQESAA